MASFRDRLSPGLRGAVFYGAFWGIIGFFDPFTNVYLDQIGLSGPQIGWLSALLPLSAMVLPLALSRLADRTSRRVPILSGVALLYSLSLLLMPIPKTFLPIFGVMVLLAIFRSPIAPMADGLVARMADKYQVDFGRMRLWGSLIFTITAIGLAPVWQWAGYPAMYISAGIMFLLVSGVSSLLEETPATHAPANRQPIPIFKDLGLLVLLGATFLVGLAMSMVGTFGGVYMARLGGSQMEIGAILGISALFEVPAMFVGRRIFNRLGGPRTLLLGYGLVTICCVGFALAPTAGWMLAVTGFRGFGFGLYYISSVTMLNDRAPEALCTTYQSIMYALGWGIAPTLGSFLSGILFDSLGPSRLFLISAGVVIGAILLLPLLSAVSRGSLAQAAAGAPANAMDIGEKNVPG